MEHPMRDERALVVLRRPGSAEISDADKYVFRVMCEAAAGRKTAPCAFYVTGPERVQEVTETARNSSFIASAPSAGRRRSIRTPSEGPSATDGRKARSPGTARRQR